jgi:hypothetical protein
MLTGDEGEEDYQRRSLRTEEQGYTWIGAPRMIRMPWDDDYGNPVFLDVRRWVPAGDVFDMNQGSGALPLPAWLQFGGPLMIGAELMLNKQAFTGREITNPYTDDAADRAEMVGGFLWKSWMPSAPWVPGSWYWEKISNAASGVRDREGRPYSISAAVSSSVGIKAKAQDVEQGFDFHGYEFDRIERELNAQLRRLTDDYMNGRFSRARYERELARI